MKPSASSSEGGRIRGVTAKTPDGTAEIRADLVVGCDGRQSRTRQAAKFAVQEFGVPIDVLWFRISRTGNDPEQLLGNINYASVLILIPRGDYFQAGFVIRKGSFDEIKQHGLDQFQQRLRRIAPYLGDRVEELRDWEQVKLLSVQINRLRQWHRPGLLCIGDAAHAMSPVFGVGINLAIQDAVATANLLADALRQGRVTEALLASVQQRREFPARVTQFLQVNAHKATANRLPQSGSGEGALAAESRGKHSRRPARDGARCRPGRSSRAYSRRQKASRLQWATPQEDCYRRRPAGRRYRAHRAPGPRLPPG